MARIFVAFSEKLNFIRKFLSKGYLIDKTNPSCEMITHEEDAATLVCIYVYFQLQN